MTDSRVIVTAVVVSEEAQESFTTHQAAGEDIKDVIKEATDGVLEAFRDDAEDLTLPYRVFVHVDTVPASKRTPTVIETILPEQIEDGGGEIETRVVS